MTDLLPWPGPLVRLGWATARRPNPPARAAAGRVFLFRGQGVVFTPGFGRLCGRFRAAGFWAEDLRCVGDGWAFRHLLADPAPGPVVLVGHSRGGRRALGLARRLGEHSVAVRLVVCVDVAFPPAVPANVARAIHLFRSRWRLYPARPLRPAPGSAAAVENVDLDGPSPPVPARGLHHLNITASPAVQDWLFRRAAEAAAG